MLRRNFLKNCITVLGISLVDPKKFLLLNSQSKPRLFDRNITSGNGYRLSKRQLKFLNSYDKNKICGGAIGGGKTVAQCIEVLNLAITEEV